MHSDLLVLPVPNMLDPSGSPISPSDYLDFNSTTIQVISNVLHGPWLQLQYGDLQVTKKLFILLTHILNGWTYIIWRRGWCQLSADTAAVYLQVAEAWSPSRHDHFLVLIPVLSKIYTATLLSNYTHPDIVGWHRWCPSHCCHQKLLQGSWICRTCIADMRSSSRLIQHWDSLIWCIGRFSGFCFLQVLVGIWCSTFRSPAQQRNQPWLTRPYLTLAECRLIECHQ